MDGHGRRSRSTNRTGRTQHYDDDPPAKSLVTTSKSATHPVWDESRVPSSTTTSAVDTHALDKTFTESKPLAFEILRLKDAGAAPMTVMMRQAQWVQLAKKEGQSPPTAVLDPPTATPAEIARATCGSRSAATSHVPSSSQPPDVPKMRALGEAGDQTESLPAGRVAPQAVKH